jgi:hypothetical protein
MGEQKRQTQILPLSAMKTRAMGSGHDKGKEDMDKQDKTCLRFAPA